MPVKMQPTSVIKARLGIEPNGRVHKFFTHTCRIHNDKYVSITSSNSLFLASVVDFCGVPYEILYPSVLSLEIALFCVSYEL